MEFAGGEGRSRRTLTLTNSFVPSCRDGEKSRSAHLTGPGRLVSNTNMTSADSPPVATTSPAARSCLVCGGTHLVLRSPVFVACGDCGFTSADIALSDTELATLYGREYFHGHEYLNYVAERESVQSNFRERRKTLAKLIPNLSKKGFSKSGAPTVFLGRHAGPRRLG